MYTIKELQLYGYKRVHIPKPRDLYARVGRCVARDCGSDESIPMFMNKLESIEYMDRLDREAQRQADYEAYKEEQSRLAKEREESHSKSNE